MVFRGRLEGMEAAASLKNSSVSVAVGAGYVVAWDLGGRLYSIFKGGHTFRRGLSGRFLHKWREPDVDGRLPATARSPYDERQRVLLPAAEGDQLLDESAALARRVHEAIAEHPDGWTEDEGGAASPLPSGRGIDGPGHPLLEALSAAGRFDAPAAAEDRKRFAHVYAPIGILPPDQYMSLVLQATSGCSFDTCTFCDLYHDAYRVKTPAEFGEHITQVREYLGRSESLRRHSIFLGAANALAVPMPRLLDLLAVVSGAFDGAAPPINAFVDGFTGALKDEAAYGALARRGLKRVYVGLESGHDPLLAFVRKPGTSAQAIETARAIKSAGLSVGLIVMIGLGGDRFAADHVADTIAAVNAMELGAGDLIYFSDLVEVADTPYPAIARDADVRPLDLDARVAQLAAIRRGLAFPGAPPKFARYDIREFVY